MSYRAYLAIAVIALPLHLSPHTWQSNMALSGSSIFPICSRKALRNISDMSSFSNSSYMSPRQPGSPAQLLPSCNRSKHNCEFQYQFFLVQSFSRVVQSSCKLSYLNRLPQRLAWPFFRSHPGLAPDRQALWRCCGTLWSRCSCTRWVPPWEAGVVGRAS